MAASMQRLTVAHSGENTSRNLLDAVQRCTHSLARRRRDHAVTLAFGTSVQTIQLRT